MNKKRVFSVLLAVIMVITAINFAPVMEVLATGGHGKTADGENSSKYEWDYLEGNWSDDGNGDEFNEYNANHNGSLIYTKDGAYASAVGEGGFINYDGQHYRLDSNYRTRHVTMFNDCGSHYNGNAFYTYDNKTRYHWTPYNQIEYITKPTPDGKAYTHRSKLVGNNQEYKQFQTIERTKTAISTFQQYVNENGASLEYWGNHTANVEYGADFVSTMENSATSPSAWAPFLMYGYGCRTEVQYEGYDNPDTYQGWETKEAGIKTGGYLDPNQAKFYTAKNDDDSDFRMVFRNYNNSDKTYFNPAFTSDGYTEHYTGKGETGINIAEYDYLEFDLMIDDACGWKKTRENGDSAYRIYAYYETNCAAGDYCDNQEAFIKGWSGDGGISFADQLEWEEDGDYAHYDEWVTIRIKIPTNVKKLKDDPIYKPTVKQFTIRMVGGNKANKRAVIVDDLRLVKNDDHLGVPYTHDGNGNEITDGSNVYPSGSYFMVNDFEYNGDVDLTKAVSKTDGGWDMAYTGDDKNTVDVYPVYRAQEVNMDDRMTSLGTYNNSWDAMGWALDTLQTHHLCAGKQNIITQGDFGTNVAARGGRIFDTNTFTNGARGAAEQWSTPLYYRRLYTNSINLSSFSHFSMDVFIRARGKGANGEKVNNVDNSAGLPKITGSSADGIVFSVELLLDDKVWVPVYFFLPYGDDCWDKGKAPDTGSKEYGTILPLGKVGVAGTSATDITHFTACDDSHTAHGATRFTFTRENLVDAMAKNGISGDLSKITGMQLIWCNKEDTTNKYYTYRNFESDSAVSAEDIRHADLILDNFIAYTPDTSITVVNQVSSEMDDGNKKDGTEADYLDADQSFVYRLQGGYASGNTNGFSNADLGGKVDPITGGIDLTFSVPANGQITIQNLPYNSYYISQQTWGWRYRPNSIALRTAGNDPMDMKTVNGNTGAISPVMGGNINTPIWELMKKRNISVYFDQTFVKREYGVNPEEKPTLKDGGYPDKQWLDGAHTLG